MNITHYGSFTLFLDSWHLLITYSLEVCGVTSGSVWVLLPGFEGLERSLFRSALLPSIFYFPIACFRLSATSENLLSQLADK